MRPSRTRGVPPVGRAALIIVSGVTLLGGVALLGLVTTSAASPQPTALCEVCGDDAFEEAGGGPVVTTSETLTPNSGEAPPVKHLIVHGDPGIRKGAVVEVDGEEWVCFGVSRQGEWHGPERVQLWCTVGEPDEVETFERREFVPLHLDVDAVDADEVEVLQAKGELTV